MISSSNKKNEREGQSLCKKMNFKYFDLEEKFATLFITSDGFRKTNVNFVSLKSLFFTLINDKRGLYSEYSFFDLFIL